MHYWERATLTVGLLAGLGLAAPSPAQGVAWTARYNGGFQDANSGPGGKHSIATDAAGNVYVTGSSHNGRDNDWRTIKYGPDGSVIWSVPYYGAPGDYIGAIAIALDNEGHVYVTGESASGGTTDFWTIKYQAADGSVIWSVGHDSPGHARESPRALTVDLAGNVYVTGITLTGSASDFYTIKQAASDGRVLWAARQAGAGDDEPVAIAVDAAGDAYVTGWSRGGLNDDFRTIKYASSNGSVLWSMGFDGGHWDLPSDIAVDSAGNAYVTGRSHGNGVDLRTIKYASASGEVLWNAVYPGQGAYGFYEPQPIAVDAEDNAYLASHANSDYLTIKYAGASGRVLWSVGYDGPGHGSDNAVAIGLDASGNAYVAGTAEDVGGRDYRTVKYAAADGALLWSARSAGPSDASDWAVAIAVGPTGDAAVTGTSQVGQTGDRDFLTAKYASADGAELYAVTEGVLAGTDDRPGDGGSSASPNHMTAVDSAGNSYVTGLSGGVDDLNCRTVKYSADGKLVWTASYVGTPTANCTPTSLALDGAGNVYVTGSSVSAAGRDYRTIKYASVDGSALWSVAFDGAAHGNDDAYAVAVDASGDAYVAGTSRVATGNEFRIVKYAATDGSVLWSAGHGSANSFGPMDIAVDGSGDAHVTGTYGNQALTLKRAGSDGRSLWTASTAGSARALALDALGDVYVTGHVSSGSSSNLRTFKLAASNGQLLWATQDAGLSGGMGLGIVVDRAGDTLVAGRAAGDYRTIKYSGGDGSVAWATRYDGPAHGVDEGLALALDAAGDVYVTGGSFGGENTNFRTLKYTSASGSLVWSAAHAGPGNGTDRAYGIAVDGTGRAHVTGYSFASETGTDFLTITYDSSAPSADLSVTLTDGRGTATPGAETVYSVVVRNEGPVDSAGTQVAVDFSGVCAGVAWSCFSRSGATCTAAGSGGITDIVDLPVGGFATYTAHCAIDSAAKGTLTVTATLAGPFIDPKPADNVATDVDALTPSADLSLSLTDSPDPAPVFGAVSYTLDYANGGPSQATGASLSLTLPPDLGFTSGPPACVHAAGAVTCDLGTLAAGSAGSVVVQAQAQPGTIGPIVASSAVGANEDDPSPTDNAASADTLVRFQKGDLQNDLATDLYLGNTATGENHVWLMDGVSRVAEQAFDPATPSSSMQRIVGVDDFDGDHRNDLVLWDAATGAVEFWLMNGPRRIGAPVPLAGGPVLAANWQLSATADFNADRRPDIVWRNTMSQKIVIWTMNGVTKDGSIVPTPAQAVDANWEIVGAFDVNGDGPTDLLWYNRTSGRVAYWLMDAAVQRLAGSFTTPATAGDANWKVRAAGDYGAGPGGPNDTVDLVWRNATSGRYVVWYMDFAGHRTAGTFTTPAQPDVEPLDWTIVGPR